MNSNEYQELAARTLIDGPEQPLAAEEVEMAAALLKLHSALGQITERFKKQVLHRHGSYNWDDFRCDLKKFSELQLLEGSYLFRRSLVLNQDVMVLWNVIGLLGESAEVAELLLACDLEALSGTVSEWRKELGDVAWYHAEIATKLGLSLEDIQQANIEKLRQRFPEGFTTEDSVARVDVGGAV